MLLFLVGLLAILCQIVLLRELNVACYGVELVYAVALAAWMVAGGAGAAWRWRGHLMSSAHVAWLLVVFEVASLTLGMTDQWPAWSVGRSNLQALTGSSARYLREVLGAFESAGGEI